MKMKTSKVPLLLVVCGIRKRRTYRNGPERCVVLWPQAVLVPLIAGLADLVVLEDAGVCLDLRRSVWDG